MELLSVNKLEHWMELDVEVGQNSLSLSLVAVLFTETPKCRQHATNLRQDPLIWVFGRFWLFCTIIEEVGRHLLWKFHKQIRKKSWSNVPPKLLTCIRFLYKVVHKIGRLRKFNRALEIEFNFNGINAKMRFLAQTKGRREKEKERKRKRKEEEGKEKGKTLSFPFFLSLLFLSLPLPFSFLLPSTFRLR